MKDIKIGDAVEKIIENVVPKELVERIKSNGCGCEKRKEWLNNLTNKK